MHANLYNHFTRSLSQYHVSNCIYFLLDQVLNVVYEVLSIFAKKENAPIQAFQSSMVDQDGHSYILGKQQESIRQFSSMGTPKIIF